MKEYTPEYLGHIRNIIQQGDVELARKELSELHPADIAELYQELELDEAEFLFKLLDEDTAADVLMELDEDDRLKLLNDMPAEEIAKQIDHLDTDDAVDIIQQLDEEERDEILAHIDDVEQAGDIIDLLKYPRIRELPIPPITPIRSHGSLDRVCFSNESLLSTSDERPDAS